ncbi:dTDP-4-amino-4,6-dideoxygalactose transaminase [Branchiibius hedensis]|uniref:dTDP-4-amino-4,6-dideoxygalactose transaminase n=1 Tax=Branchiibius hedensis TaxID=672460 RepID=A0A2Y8ZSC0_9MICO|nr:DegT/DnrJ/EryC1/StrS family aminotransferase [Branchiibius hedensis]PWJ26032.1 dTDP-4-amino-4,6-dideoxygalactose transaminase [Branchiibius hedensis]SSA34844.1 dTDP-4-amino-4,6-dideoxygalactose transaminase [Branchiibius hedensis]
MSQAHDVLAMLADRTGTRAADWHLVFKARHGMQVVFEEIAVDGPGSVATQVLTCATAVDPILVAGLTPVYGEVHPDSLALDPDTLPPGARAVVLQHTFGIIDEERARQVRQRAEGVLLVEDSCHCVTRMARGEDGTPLADISVHSFGIEKMLPTRFGGAIWVNPALSDRDLHARISGRLATLPVVDGRLEVAVRSYRTQNGVLNRLPAPLSGRARKALVATGILEPAIAPVETRGGVSHPPMAPSASVIAQIAQALPGLDATEKRRAAAVAIYREQLADLVQIPESATATSPLVRFPFFVADPTDAEPTVRKLTAAGHYAGRWYRPALFPGAANPAEYHYTPGDPALARTEDLIARIVNLPTDVAPDAAVAAAGVLRESLTASASSRT